MFDIGACLLLFAVFPLLMAFMHRPIHFLANIFLVLAGTKSWIGYENSESMPAGRNGVLSPSEILGKGLNPETAQRIDMLYARDYQLSNDFRILFRGFRRLGS